MVEPETEPEQHRDAADVRPRPRPPADSGAASAAEQPESEPRAAEQPQSEPERRAGSGPAHARPSRGGRRWGARALLLTALVLVVVLVAVVLVVIRGHDDGSDAAGPSAAADQSAATITGGGTANAFVAGATSDIVAVTTYDYRSLDTALSNGLPVTTGAYRASFRKALTGSLAGQARQVHRVQSFAVRAAGIGEIDKQGTSAKVLIFGVQSVTDDSTGGKARQTPVTLTATMQRQGSRYLVSGLSAGQSAGLPGGTAGLRAAAEAGRSEVVDVLTLRHDHFDADYNAALAGAVEPLRTTLTSQAAATRQRVTKGGYDLAGTVTAVGVERAAGDTLVLLVAATGTRTSAGKTSVVVDGRYRVTVVRVSGAWVTSSIAAVSAA